SCSELQPALLSPSCSVLRFRSPSSTLFPYTTLFRSVLERRADIGLAFDGDADRVFLVDEQAAGVSGSLVTALVAQSLLATNPGRSEEHTSELQSLRHLVCRLLLEKKNKNKLT